MLPLLLALALTGEGEFKDSQTNLRGKYKIELPAKACKTEPWLLVYFHGAGGGPSYDSQIGSLREATADRNIAVLAVQAPNNVMSWADGANEPPSQRWRYLVNLLDQKIYAAHAQLSPKRTVFVGWSAGSTFISGDLLPHVIGDFFHGGAVLLCGGGDPTPQGEPSRSLPVSAETKRNFKLYYTITRDDFLFGQTMQGLAYWDWRGLEISGKTLASGGHCGFDLNGALRKGLDFIGVKSQR